MANTSDSRALHNQIKAVSRIAVLSATDFASKLSYQPADKIHVFSALHFSSIIHDAWACHNLIEADLSSSVPKLLRPLIESAIVLVNMSADELYFDSMVLDSIRTEESLIRLYETGEVSVKFIPSEEIIEAKKRDFNSLRLLLKPCKKKKAFEKFKDANAEAYYFNIYVEYSRSIHGNVIELLSRHLPLSQGANQISVSKEYDTRELLTHVSELVDILKMSANSVCSILGKRENPESLAFGAAFQSIEESLASILKRFNQ